MDSSRELWIHVRSNVLADTAFTHGIEYGLPVRSRTLYLQLTSAFYEGP